jgi:riboflavin kinase/FMN adenylyltransferase
MKLLNPGKAPSLLTSTRHKLVLLSRLGVAGCVLLRFDRALAKVSPGVFARRLVACSPPLAELVVGANWRFGARGEGTSTGLKALARDAGIPVTIIRPVLFAGKPVSSTRVRKMVLAGRLRQARRLLGAPVSVLGTVVHGRAVGRKLGYPTANLDLHNEAIPPRGVYAALVRLDGADRAAVLNIGVRPTFAAGARAPTVELHVPGLRRNLYGRDIEVFIRARIRPERRFSSARALASRIARDIAIAGSLRR